MEGKGPQPPTFISEAVGWRFVNVGEIWQARELIYFLAWRDVKVRYKQTLLGAAWAVLQPTLMMLVFTLFFGGIDGVSSGGLPYPLFVYAGLILWTFFATAITAAGNSVVGSERLITKIYFPRLIIPFASVGAAAVDLTVTLGLLIALMAYYRIAPGPWLALVPVVLAMTTMMALGVGTLLASLNVAFRDFRYVIPFAVQLWMFATPAIYMQSPSSGAEASPDASAPAIPGQRASLGDPDPSDPPSGRRSIRGEAARAGLLRAVKLMNPLNGLISAFRAAALGGPFPWRAFGTSSILSLIAFFLGCFYFRKVEDSFADVI